MPWPMYLIIGPLYAELISGHSILVYMALRGVYRLSWWHAVSGRGLGCACVRSAKIPAAVDTAGDFRGRPALCGGGDLRRACAGIAGAYLSDGFAGQDLSKTCQLGAGFIALAALIFAKWRPWYALYATFLFGLLEAISNRYPSLDLGFVTLPSQFMQALPYILTVVILGGLRREGHTTTRRRGALRQRAMTESRKSQYRVF